MAKIAGLPSDCTICRYNVSNSNDPDGIMHSCCVRTRNIYKQKYPNADILTYSRHIIIILDSMHTKGQFGVSRNTNELVAVLTGSFEDDVIANKLTMLEENSNGEEVEGPEMKLPGVSKHCLVFIWRI